MKLTTRVSTFFLATLAVVLCTYSLVFYGVARRHIGTEFDYELRGALNSLVAAAEVEQTEVKWQPLEHSISFGTHDRSGEINWLVIGDRNVIVEQSHHAPESFVAQSQVIAARAVAAGQVFRGENETESSEQLFQRLVAPDPQAVDRQLDEFDELLVIVSCSTVQRDQTLWRLCLLVILLPVAVWLCAAAVGRQIVRRALRPVIEMAGQARSIQGTDFQTRLHGADSDGELSELRSAFNRLLDRQQVAFDQQRRFAGDAAHQLRTPLTVLMGQIDVTLRRPRSVDDYQSNLGLLRSQTADLQGIVESLLFLSRSDEDAVTPTLGTVALASWIENNSTRGCPADRHDDLRLNNQLDETIQVRATPMLLSQISENLVSNACKYSRPETAVIVDARADAQTVQISVSDSGLGIADDERDLVFDPFYRSPSARRSGVTGTGLGLAIAVRIAKSLGGELRCESEQGVGSCFTLVLPIARPDASTGSGSSSMPQA
ncbi:HAMP domain-containing histidine kinase [Stieleria sp. TO1_6]|uniref:sensor histidine kinase n=1 Tax=Stieleria tagensis TaxID=2956795 RepID=UPI00209B385C|nr:ATP-binding protein [Stieleria tagensis]MCO8120930.1 HAMP domain-containing histidine kinase [Stieleria tagensis]